MHCYSNLGAIYAKGLSLFLRWIKVIYPNPVTVLIPIFKTRSVLACEESLVVTRNKSRENFVFEFRWLYLMMQLKLIFHQ